MGKMAPRPDYDLIIFDCDGVLVDSEMLSATVLTAQLAKIGIDLSFDQFRDDFLGRSFAKATARLSARTGMTLPDNFQTQYFDRLLQMFATDLQAMPGVHRVLDSMTVAHCVASSSLPARLDMALRVCDLERYFGSSIYSATLVPNAKPAPDLFLYAANAHGAHPSRCLVIEDSAMGVLAAQAAGMTAWHFAGGAHIAAGYALPTDLQTERVVHNMTVLHDLFCETGICLNGRVGH